MNKALLIITFFITSTQIQAQFWTQVDSDFPTESTGISRFSIVDENIAWGIGYNGINPNNNLQQFSKTTDAGATWNAGVFSVGNVGLGIGDITALSDQTAYIAVHARAAGQEGGVWKTVDAGTTWVKSTTNQFTAAASFPNTIHFFDANNGVVMGDPVNSVWEVYTTSDAGATWTTVAGPNIPSPQTNETGYLAQKAFSGNSIWFTTSTGRIFHSTNRGSSWNVYQSPINDFGGTTVSGDLSFSNDSKGIIQTQAGVLYQTTNAGQSWNQITTSGAGRPYGGNISYIPNSDAIVSVGSDPSFAGSSYSKDDGTTWINIDNVQHVDIAFFNAATGYSGGFTAATDDRGVFKYSSTVLSNEDIAFAKANTLYPNPTKNQLNITGQQVVLQLDVVNLSGQMIKTAVFSRSIDVENLASGMYLVRIKTIEGTETLPFIKE